MTIGALVFVWLCGGLALLYGVWASKSVLSASAGNERMQEIAHAIGFLLHPLAGYMTGQTLHIDGGLTISAARL